VLRVVRLWVDHGVTLFRVDNPHTKPVEFWEWLIATVNADHPECCSWRRRSPAPR
jgi:starch synthase (maltosyl-transferring)